MDIYGVVETCITAAGTCVATIGAFVCPDRAPLVEGITGAVVTCGVAICGVLRKYNTKKAIEAKK